MKKVLAGVGVALGGAALLIATQGSAQAATSPEAPATVASAEGPGKAPAALGSWVGKAAGKAWVHGKAACSSVANSAGEFANMVGGVSPANTPEGRSVEMVFDK
ncbi:hypothetical protein J7E96_30700 [Streptomyces sp. ISL-96]|uniref:hypothetical protein n=1 Tax=Streptomyces sp. ISL-96 TaxID=2819191 RepID=UPI001BE6A73A|nr:hypothetical protein [Streptomyces sp. ISL-96]MBT2492803.1 hypothetical protein [Streptomyces sp. ISL-96]